MCYLKIYNFSKVKRQKNNNEKIKLQNHTKHLWKKPKHNPLHFERAYIAHFQLE
jgi:hypothetical protein